MVRNLIDVCKVISSDQKILYEIEKRKAWMVHEKSKIRRRGEDRQRNKRVTPFSYADGIIRTMVPFLAGEIWNMKSIRGLSWEYRKPMGVGSVWFLLYTECKLLYRNAARITLLFTKKIKKVENYSELLTSSSYFRKIVVNSTANAV